jgi:hypothetical protein
MREKVICFAIVVLYSNFLFKTTTTDSQPQKNVFIYIYILYIVIED